MSAHDLMRCVDHATDAAAANRQQAALLFNATPEIDSLAERLITLHQHGVPRHHIRQLLADVKKLIALNDDEHHCERTIAGALDALARAEHAAERGTRGRDQLTIRGLVRALRDDLDTIATAAGGTEYALAATRVREVCEHVPAEKLLGGTLRHELGGRRHDLLAEIVRSVRL